MERWKSELFERCVDALDVYQKLDGDLVFRQNSRAFGIFCGLYDLIEGLNLECEYQAFKAVYMSGKGEQG